MNDHAPATPLDSTSDPTPGAAAHQGTKAKKKRTINWGVVRFWWAVAMIVGFFFASVPLAVGGESGDWLADVEVAAANYTLQEGNAEGAPQQAVLNGWHTNDLLEVQAKIAGDQKEQLEHVTRMLFFLGLGVLGDTVFRNAHMFRAARKAQAVSAARPSRR